MSFWSRSQSDTEWGLPEKRRADIASGDLIVIEVEIDRNGFKVSFN